MIVESIESDFVPSLIFNNKKADEKKLKRFNEPAWNNPVVRFLDSDLKDVIPRKDEIWTAHDLVARMIAALKTAKRPVPFYLELTRLEKSPKTEHASFAMHCYWEGEVQLGKLAGVKSTHSAWYDDKEIVTVQFDPTVISYGDLIDAALAVRCADKIYPHSSLQQAIAEKKIEANNKASEKPDRRKPGVHNSIVESDSPGRKAKPADQKYYLEKSILRLLPLTEIQKMHVNSALGRRISAEKILSPKQARMLSVIKAKAKADPSWIDSLNSARNKASLVDYFFAVDILTMTKPSP